MNLIIIGQKTNVPVKPSQIHNIQYFCKLLKTNSYMYIGVDMEAYFSHEKKKKGNCDILSHNSYIPHKTHNSQLKKYTLNSEKSMRCKLANAKNNEKN